MNIANLIPLTIDLVAAGSRYDIDRLLSALSRLDSTMGIDFPTICHQINEDAESDIDHDQMWNDIFDETDLRVRARNFVSLATRPHLVVATEGEPTWAYSSARILMTGLQVPVAEMARLSSVLPNSTLALRWEPASRADQPPSADTREQSGWIVFQSEMRD